MTTSPEYEGIDTLWRVIWSYLHQNTPPRAADHSQQSIDLAWLVRESDWLAQIRADERRKVAEEIAAAIEWQVGSTSYRDAAFRHAARIAREAARTEEASDA